MNELLNKLNELTEAEKNLLSDKQKKALKTLIGCKPSVPFSSATLNDCVRPDGLGLNIDYITIDVPTLHIPNSFAKPTPSDFLCQNLSRIKTVWVDNEKACRIVIDAILTEVLLDESNEQRMIGKELDLDIRTKSVDNMDSFLLVVEAKKEWPDSAIPQVLCEAGCLLKKRLAAGKNTPVFSILTNSTDFRFFAIDTDSVVYASKRYLLEAGEDLTYNTSSSLSETLRWFSWFMSAIKSISPRASGEDLTAEMVQDSLSELRNSFGPKHPISSKKLKIRK